MTKEQLGTLIITSEKQMYATSKSILKDDNDCYDAIQEAIVKAFGKVECLKEDRYAKTWLTRILMNECYNILRKGSRQVSLEDCAEAETMAVPEKKDYGPLYEAVRRLKVETDSKQGQKNYISALEPGESVQVKMAWITNEKELGNMYLNLCATGGLIEFSEYMKATGIVDIRQ